MRMSRAMSTKALMDVEEYLRTSFDGSDCEFLDGAVVERNWGDLPHATLHANLSGLLSELRKRLGIRVLISIRIQIDARRFRVADIAVWHHDNIGTRIPTVAPFLVVEILSPEDRMVRMVPKIQEYLSIGVEWVWVIDPEEKAALSYSRKHPEGAAVTTLRTENPDIEIAIESAFDLDA
jgi:Uma2 family endonuclease